MSEKQELLKPFQFKSGYQNTRIHSRNSLKHLENAPDMTYETVHPDNKAENFIFTFLNPDAVFSKSFGYDDPDNPRNNQELHYHDFFELLYVIQGEMYQQIESERHLYPAGSLCLLNCNVRHQEECSSDYRTVFLRLPTPLIAEILNDMNSYFFEIEQRLKGHLQERFFTDSLDEPYAMRKEYIDFIPYKDKPEVKDYMYELFDRLTQQLLYPTIGSSYLVKHTIILILKELSVRSHYHTIPLNVGTDAEAQLFNSISSLIKSQHGHLSRKELEDKLSYNGNYLNRIVKKYTGLSLHQYGMTFAIKEAAALLQHSDMYISGICNKLHFSNQTYFYKLFVKTYGMTPNQYRKKHNTDK